MDVSHRRRWAIRASWLRLDNSWRTDLLQLRYFPMQCFECSVVVALQPVVFGASKVAAGGEPVYCAVRRASGRLLGVWEGTSASGLGVLAFHERL